MNRLLILPVVFLFLIGFVNAVAQADCVASSCIGWVGGNCIGWVGPFATPGNACSSDNNVCTTDVCGAEAFQCLHNAIAGCCNSDSDCDDSNGATLDSCVSHTCSNIQIAVPTPCDDGNACTTNDINLAGICHGEPITCNDNNPFTDDSCNPATGCVFTSNLPDCNDNNACTTDFYSITAFGCEHSAVTCDDQDVGTTDSCNPLTGCVYTPINDPAVPEFGLVAGGIALVGALGIFLYRRK